MERWPDATVRPAGASRIGQDAHFVPGTSLGTSA
jgi:hypothetical protein